MVFIGLKCVKDAGVLQYILHASCKNLIAKQKKKSM